MAFLLALCLNWGMAKLISGTVTIGFYDGPLFRTYKAEGGFISSTDGGKTHNISLNPAKHKVSTLVPDAQLPVRDERALCDAPVSPEAEAMVKAAQETEKAALDAALVVQDAQREAQEMLDHLNHDLNRKILAFLHTGKGNMDATKVLEAAGIWASDDRTAAVACFEVDKLYGVDTLDTGL